MKLLCIVGARPNFMKIAPIMRAIRAYPDRMEARLVHTGQHYDVAMNQRFFEQLGIPAPDVSLEVGSGSHAVQTAEIMRRFEPVLEAERADCVLVVGDVNSTVACALVAAKKGVKVVHVEAGLRSRDRSMPEEINRLLTDQLSDRLYVTEADAIDNLGAEGIAAEKVCFVGNVMIDTLRASLAEAVPAAVTLAQAGARQDTFLLPPGYAVLTLHRPSNVDEPGKLAEVLETLARVSVKLPIVFPVHPRTLDRIAAAGLQGFLESDRLLPLPPVGYLEMIGLMQGARLLLTDSGGLQEEATALGLPCLTLRENTERPITVSQGTNTLVGTDRETILREVDEVLSHGGGKKGRQPELWDGHAAPRLVEDLLCWWESRATSDCGGK